MRHWHGSRRSSAAPFPFTGERRRGGFLKRCASMLTKGRGTRTRATGTTAGCSFCGLRGDQWEAMCDLIPPRLVSSCTGPGWCTGGTGVVGASGVRPGLAAFAECPCYADNQLACTIHGPLS